MSIKKVTNHPTHNEGLIFERSQTGRVGYRLPKLVVPVSEADPAELRRSDNLDGVPEVSEIDVVRHFTRISTCQQRGGGTECQAGYTSIRANTLDGGMVCVLCPTGYKAPEYNTMIVTHAVNGYAVCVACRKGRPDFNPDTKGYVCRE